LKVALLSNVNADFVLRSLSKKFDCVPSVGYGDVWGQLLESGSTLNTSSPDAIVFLMDIEQLLDGCLSREDSKMVIDEWFSVFDSIIKKDRDHYISNVMFRSACLSDNDSFYVPDVLFYWNEALKSRIDKHSNVHLLDVNESIFRRGKATVFSDKMWYMGKIPYSNEGCRIVADSIISTLSLLNRTPKKVLVLDMDNTLWGGVLGELGVDGIALSDNHIGAIYKKVQQLIKAIKNTGIVLAIVSKNNESDVQEVWDNHPYMFLRKENFASLRINWEDKVDNIQSIAKELNLGTDSFVFIDDMAQERDNIRMRLPDVVVPDFPDKIEDYPLFIENIYNSYFKRTRLLSEDREKTRQYAENALRVEVSKNLSFEDFLKTLDLRVERLVLDDAKLDRIAQLHGKTNQFNLTTKRYTRKDIDRLLNENHEIYAFNVKDRFGDYGLVAVAIVDLGKDEIVSFLMSCRVMGKLIENYVINEIERDLLEKGHSVLHARYIRTAKNAPVEDLFDKLGYSVTSRTENETKYEICLADRTERKFFVNQQS
jgi:FkbH-like protein